MNPQRKVLLKARDGLTIPTLLTIPLSQAENPKNLPAVLLPHGGPEEQDWLGFNWEAQALASRGYLVIQPQFRGSSGFGVRHQLAGRGEWGRKMQHDLTDTLQTLVKEKFVDANRVCIMGSSYGGYAALAGGAYTPDLYRCVVSINGVTDIEDMLDYEKSEHGRNHWVLAYWKDVIAKGKADEEFLRSISPTEAADRFRAPVLLIHGTKDKIVPYRQSEAMYKKLKKADKSVELVKLRGEDHHLSQAETRRKALKTALEFVDEHIGNTSL